MFDEKNRERLASVAWKLEAMSSTGDAVTDPATFELASELRSVLADLRVEVPDETHSGSAHLYLGEWCRDDAVATLTADSSDARFQFVAQVFFVPALWSWRSIVAMNGSLIFLYEDKSRDKAMYQARLAIHRAWELRGPLR